MKILITGQNGFIGKALFDLLERQGQEVIGAVRIEQQAHKNKNIFPVGDVNSKTNWLEMLSDIDVVIHLANRAHVLNDHEKDPLAVFREVNVEGTAQLARQAAKSGVKRFIFVSSIKVNGERTDVKPFSASDKPNPQDPYAVSKLEAEDVLRKISTQSSMEFVIIRPPLVYGEGVKGNFERLTRLIESGMPLPLASLTNKRSLISLENLVQLLAKCTFYPAVANQILLVLDGDDVSTPQLIKKIAHSINKPARLFRFPPGLLKLVGSLIGQSNITRRLSENLQIDGITNRELTFDKKIRKKNGKKAKI